MSVGDYAVTYFEELTLLVVALLIAKTLFEESVVVDRKNLFWFGVTALFQTIFDTVEQRYNCDICSYISFIFLILSFGAYVRGEKKGRWKRIRAAVDSFLIYVMSVSFYCTMVFIMLKPSMAAEFSFIGMLSFNIMICIIGIIVVLYLYFTLFQKGICLNFKTKERVLMIFFNFFVCFAAGVISAIFEEQNANIPTREYRYLFIFCISIIYIVTPLFMIKNKLSMYYEMGQKHQQEMLQLELQHFERYKEAQEETRRYRHDMLNHLMVIQMLQQEGKQQEAGEYVNELLGHISSLSPEVVTGSDLLDCIVTSKLEMMKSNNIYFEIDGVLDQGLAMSPVDICAVFANALDNAIEALLQVEGERRFYMRLKRTKTYYMITMQNTVSQIKHHKSLLQKKRFTTKEDKELHGYGLQNMRSAIAKYSGEIITEMTDGQFILTILLSVSGVKPFTTTE